jgi:hypothetical protein
VSTSWHAHIDSRRRHRARQIRANIVQLTREYRVACDVNDELLAVLLRGEENTALLREAEHRSWEAMEGAREALFSALEELDMLEGEETP